MTQIILDAIAELQNTRSKIKEDFIKTWLSVHMPADIPADVAAAWIVNNVCLVEIQEHNKVTFQLELKKAV